ncbi:MAG TPA: PAS-domain containing protein [Stellaceae bacterium]|nr:PAS-domain containing protein [Stellaceae bacterium]
MARPSWLTGFTRHVRLQNAMIVLCTILVSAYGASMYGSLHRSFRQTLDDATGGLQSIARSAEVGTNRSIFEIDAMLLGVERMLETMLPNAPLSDPSVKQLLNQFNDQTLTVRDIVIVDRDGQLINNAGSTATTPPRDLASQPWFTAHQKGGLPSLYVGRPERSRATGSWSIMLSRPLMQREKIVGVIAAEVPITVFTDFYSSVVANGAVHVALLLDDGTLVASEPHREEAIGHQQADMAAVLVAARQRRAGVIASSPDGTGDVNLFSFEHIPARPLILTASRTRDDILAQWRSECIGSLVAFVLFAATAGTLTWMMVRAFDRQQRAAIELRAGEERLKRQSDLQQSTLENMGEGLSVFDRKGRLMAWNSRFVEMLSLPPDLSSETTLQDILALQAVRGDFGPVDTKTEVQERFKNFFRDIPYVRERITRNGHTLQIRRRAMPGGAVVSLYSDITERKAAEVKMAQAWAQAELANRAKGDFLANMSHELRTPLNAIIGFSEILSGEHLGPLKNPRYLEYSSDIHSSGLHLLSIINDVLDMSKIEAGKLDIHEEEIEIRQLLASSLRMVRERARKQQVELVCHADDPYLAIFADERAMKQCLLNLLSNAVKFSKTGGRVTVDAHVDAEHRTAITITDDGIGMTEAEQERALQPFGQAHASTTRTYGGTGLGLPITQGLVEAHGGAMSIVSNPGTGTCVSIILPAERTRTAPAAAQLAVRV